MSSKPSEYQMTKSGEAVKIENVTFSPTTLGSGELLNVSITVFNGTTETLPTQGPDPGFVYDEGDTFRSRGFTETNGTFRVGVDFDGRTGIDHPYRWGLGAPLAPGETVTITGAIRLRTGQMVKYWAGLVREQVAWLQDRRGEQIITVNPAAQITNATFTPTTVNAGGLLNVSITVRNDSAETLPTQGPDPGFVYDEGDTFRSRGFTETNDTFRVGVDFDGRTGIDHPYRWGLGAPLAPGETVTITGAIRLRTVQTVKYWAGLVHEQVAWLQDRQGELTITVNPVGAVKITDVILTPTTLSEGRLLNVIIMVRNDSTELLPTQGPDPGFAYDEGDTFRSRGFTETTGTFRVGVDFDGRTGVDHPYRWGLGAPLAPGESMTITGAIRLQTARAINYWCGLVREKIAWLEDRQGMQLVTVKPVHFASFAAAPNTIAPGASAMLEWNTQDADQVTLDGASVPASGARVVTPTQTTTYALHVVFTDGVSKDLSVTLTVEQNGLAAMLQFDHLPFLRHNTLAGGQSSYDRTGGNRDWSNYLYIDSHGDHVLLDLRGSGTVYRVWVTGFNRDVARIKFYFDGETTPRVDMLMRDLFEGMTSPFLSPLVGDDTASSGGYYCYVPMSFNRGIKITANGTGDSNFYYNIGYHVYSPDTPVTTWTTAEDNSAVRALWNRVGLDPKSDSGNTTVSGIVNLGIGAAQPVFEVLGPRALSSIRLGVPGVVARPASEIFDILNGIWIRIYWDNESNPSVSAPLGSFFAIGQFGTYRARSLAAGLDDSNTLYMYFPMPFEKHARIELFNSRGVPANGISYEIKHKPFAFPFAQVGYFKTQFTQQTATPGDGRDAMILDTEGTGHMVGVVLSIIGEANRLYLEGDERIYIDDSQTPAIYGTGTEDFFNGGWYFRSGPFSLPLHGNTANIHDDSFDRTAAYRLFLQDAIPFNKHLTAGIEHGPVNDASEEAWTLAYYYHKPSVRSVLTDTLDVGNIASEQSHSYVITNPTWNGERSYSYEGVADNVSIGDTGRAHIGYSQFVMAIQPSNEGVILRRRFDYWIGNQNADVFVDGARVGTWHRAGGNSTHRWRDDEFMIPSSFTKGKSSIVVRVVFMSSDSDWNEFRYSAYTCLGVGQQSDHAPVVE